MRTTCRRRPLAGQHRTRAGQPAGSGNLTASCTAHGWPCVAGYSGVAILSRQEPLSVSCGIGDAAHDGEVGLLCAAPTAADCCVLRLPLRAPKAACTLPSHCPTPLFRPAHVTVVGAARAAW